MKTKNRASKARVSKIPSTPPSVVARVLNEMVSFNGVDDSTERLDQSPAAKRLRVSTNDGTCVVEPKSGNELSDVPETSSCGGGGRGFHATTTTAPDSTHETTICEDGHGQGSLNSFDILNWECPQTFEWTEQGLCIKCNKGGDVLICSNADCPLSVHECCLGYTPSFDDTGKYYCPICSYRRALVECDEMEKELALAKEKAHVVRDSCFVFINGRCEKQNTQLGELNKSMEIGGKESSRAPSDRQEPVDASKYINEISRVHTSLGNKGDGVSVTRGDQAKKVSSPEQKSVEDQQVAVKSHANERYGVLSGVESHSKQVDSPRNRSAVVRQDVTAAVDFINVDSGVETSLLTHRKDVRKFRGHHVKQVDHCQSNREVKNQQHAEVPTSGDRRNSDCIEVTTPLNELFQDRKEMNNVEASQEQPCASVTEEELSEANVGFETCRDVATFTNHANCRTQGTAEHSKSMDPPGQSSTPSVNSIEIAENQSLEKTATSKPMKSYKPVKHPSNPAIPNSKRKKLIWTNEEEEMLKEAVEKFSRNAGKNLSWKNILEFGSHVFNASRTPVDLKDKWRNMVKGQSRGRKR